MRYTRIALLTTITTLQPLVTPAVAELGHPSGCLTCSHVEVTAGPPGATAPSRPETDTATAQNIRHVRHHSRRAAPAGTVTTLAPQPGGIRSVAHVCAWDALDWDELYDPEKKAFETLGWSRDNWNSDNGAASSSKDWSELTYNERTAAQALGYNETNWEVSCPNDIPD
jgi:hypothetical protein